MQLCLCGIFVLLSLQRIEANEEPLCPFDPNMEMAHLRKHLKLYGTGKEKIARYPLFPHHVFYTGLFDSHIQNLTIGAGVWPEDYKFHYYSDEQMAKSMMRLSKELEAKEGISGAFDAYRALRAMSFRADLWRYAIMWACGGVYIDSKMQLATDFEQFIARAELEPPFDTPNLTEQEVILTCNDKWGTRLDRYKNLTAFWQGFLVVNCCENSQLIRVIRHVVQNIQNRIYPNEGKVSRLYITGPCAMARAIQIGHQEWHQDVRVPCHFGIRGPRMRTVWSPVQDVMIQNEKLHVALHGGDAHAYSALYQARQVYYDDPPCTQNCALLNIEKGQLPEDRPNDHYFRDHQIPATASIQFRRTI